MDSPGEILSLCRLCLVKDQVNIPIFDEQGDIRQIFLKISSCLPVTITRHDQLPKRICDACSNKLDLLYEFWNSSASAEKTLLSWLGQAGVKDAGKKISAVAQQIAKPAETLVKEESESLEDSHMINESQDSFEDQSLDEGTKDEAEAPPPKRARRTAAVKAQINITPESDEDEDDDFDAGEAMTKIEDESDESESELKDDPSYSEVPGTSADDQAGPSGVGKDGVEAPLFITDDKFNENPLLYSCCKCKTEFDQLADLTQHIVIMCFDKTPSPMIANQVKGSAKVAKKNIKRKLFQGGAPRNVSTRNTPQSQSDMEIPETSPTFFAMANSTAECTNPMNAKLSPISNSKSFQSPSCLYCYKTFSSNYHLKRHLSRSRNCKPFLAFKKHQENICQYCRFKFRSPYSLKTHFLTYGKSCKRNGNFVSLQNNITEMSSNLNMKQASLEPINQRIKKRPQSCPVDQSKILDKECPGLAKPVLDVCGDQNITSTMAYSTPLPNRNNISQPGTDPEKEYNEIEVVKTSRTLRKYEDNVNKTAYKLCDTPPNDCFHLKRCTYCQQSFSFYYELKQHMSKKCEKLLAFKMKFHVSLFEKNICKYCSLKFRSSIALKQHMWVYCKHFKIIRSKRLKKNSKQNRNHVRRQVSQKRNQKFDKREPAIRIHKKDGGLTKTSLKGSKITCYSVGREAKSDTGSKHTIPPSEFSNNITNKLELLQLENTKYIRKIRTNHQLQTDEAKSAPTSVPYNCSSCDRGFVVGLDLTIHQATECRNNASRVKLGENANTDILQTSVKSAALIASKLATDEGVTEDGSKLVQIHIQEETIETYIESLSQCPNDQSICLKQKFHFDKGSNEGVQEYTKATQNTSEKPLLQMSDISGNMFDLLSFHDPNECIKTITSNSGCSKPMANKKGQDEVATDIRCNQAIASDDSESMSLKLIFQNQKLAPAREEAELQKNVSNVSMPSNTVEAIVAIKIEPSSDNLESEKSISEGTEKDTLTSSDKNKILDKPIFELHGNSVDCMETYQSVTNSVGFQKIHIKLEPEDEQNIGHTPSEIEEATAADICEFNPHNELETSKCEFENSSKTSEESSSNEIYSNKNSTNLLLSNLDSELPESYNANKIESLKQIIIKPADTNEILSPKSDQFASNGTEVPTVINVQESGKFQVATDNLVKSTKIGAFHHAEPYSNNNSSIKLTSESGNRIAQESSEALVKDVKINLSSENIVDKNQSFRSSLEPSKLCNTKANTADSDVGNPHQNACNTNPNELSTGTKQTGKIIISNEKGASLQKAVTEFDIGVIKMDPNQIETNLSKTAKFQSLLSLAQTLKSSKHYNGEKRTENEVSTEPKLPVLRPSNKRSDITSLTTQTELSHASVGRSACPTQDADTKSHKMKAEFNTDHPQSLINPSGSLDFSKASNPTKKFVSKQMFNCPFCSKQHKNQSDLSTHKMLYCKKMNSSKIAFKGMISADADSGSAVEKDTTALGNEEVNTVDLAESGKCSNKEKSQVNEVRQISVITCNICGSELDNLLALRNHQSKFCKIFNKISPEIQNRDESPPFISQPKVGEGAKVEQNPVTFHSKRNVNDKSSTSDESAHRIKVANVSCHLQVLQKRMSRSSIVTKKGGDSNGTICNICGYQFDNSSDAGNSGTLSPSKTEKVAKGCRCMDKILQTLPSREISQTDANVDMKTADSQDMAKDKDLNSTDIIDLQPNIAVEFEDVDQEDIGIVNCHQCNLAFKSEIDLKFHQYTFCLNNSPLETSSDVRNPKFWCEMKVHKETIISEKKKSKKSPPVTFDLRHTLNKKATLKVIKPVSAAPLDTHVDQSVTNFDKKPVFKERAIALKVDFLRTCSDNSGNNNITLAENRSSAEIDSFKARKNKLDPEKLNSDSKLKTATSHKIPTLFKASFDTTVADEPNVNTLKHDRRSGEIIARKSASISEKSMRSRSPEKSINRKPAIYCEACGTSIRNIPEIDYPRCGHKETIIRCPVCKGQYPNINRLISHLDQVHSEDEIVEKEMQKPTARGVFKYYCCFCGFNFNFIKNLINHMKTHHKFFHRKSNTHFLPPIIYPNNPSIKGFACVFCDNTVFSTLESLFSHEDVSKSHKRNYRIFESLEQNYNPIEERKFEHICFVCDLGFISFKAQQMHMLESSRHYELEMQAWKSAKLQISTKTDRQSTSPPGCSNRYLSEVKETNLKANRTVTPNLQVSVTSSDNGNKAFSTSTSPENFKDPFQSVPNIDDTEPIPVIDLGHNVINTTGATFGSLQNANSNKLGTSFALNTSDLLKILQDPAEAEYEAYIESVNVESVNHPFLRECKTKETVSQSDNVDNLMKEIHSEETAKGYTCFGCRECFKSKLELEKHACSGPF